MLAKRIIPCLDVKDGRVVKGTRFTNLRDAGDPVELAAFYDREGADEVVFLDITASAERRETMIDVVRRTAEEAFIPLTVGGGIRTVEDVRRMLRAGADKVGINTAAVQRPELIAEAADRFGAQCVVVAIDAKRVASMNAAERSALAPRDTGGGDAGAAGAPGARPAWRVYTHGGRVPTSLDAVAWAQRAARLGAGEILLTSMDRDGTEDGYDLDLTRAVAEAVPVPVIASGGAGTMAHFEEALTAGGADAALAASLFHYRKLTLRDLKQYLRARGVPVRP